MIANTISDADKKDHIRVSLFTRGCDLLFIYSAPVRVQIARRARCHRCLSRYTLFEHENDKIVECLIR